MTLRFQSLPLAFTLAICSWTAVAASTTELVVSGRITPSACTPTLSQGGVIDHGKISAKDLSPSNATVIGNDSIQMSVTCEGQTLLAIRATDNRAGTASGEFNYGIGLVGGKPLGAYFLLWRKPLADDVMVQSIGSYNQGATWLSETIAEPGMYMSVAPLGHTHTPYAIKRLDLDLGVQTYITRTAGLDLSNEVPIDGSATLEVMYL